MHTISFNYTYVLPAVLLLCIYKYYVYGLAMFFCYNHRYYKAYNIYGYKTSLVFHLESSNENLKWSLGASPCPWGSGPGGPCPSPWGSGPCPGPWGSGPC